MKYAAAYCLLALAGKSNASNTWILIIEYFPCHFMLKNYIAEADLKKFMTAAGSEVSDDQIKSVCDALKGRELHEVCFWKLINRLSTLVWVESHPWAPVVAAGHQTPAQPRPQPPKRSPSKLKSRRKRRIWTWVTCSVKSRANFIQLHSLHPNKFV